MCPFIYCPIAHSSRQSFMRSSTPTIILPILWFYSLNISSYMDFTSKHSPWPIYTSRHSFIQPQDIEYYLGKKHSAKLLSYKVERRNCSFPWKILLLRKQGSKFMAKAQYIKWSMQRVMGPCRKKALSMKSKMNEDQKEHYSSGF